jgi:hypothetical protein
VMTDHITMTFFEVEQFVFSNDTFEVAWSQARVA